MSDMMYPLITSLQREATSTDTFTAKTRKLAPGDLIELCGIGARNLNSASKVVDMGVIRGNSIYYMKSVTLTTAGIWYFTRFHVKIPSDYQVQFRIITPTDGDLFTFNIFGFMEAGSSQHVHSG